MPGAWQWCVAQVRNRVWSRSNQEYGTARNLLALEQLVVQVGCVDYVSGLGWVAADRRL